MIKAFKKIAFTNAIRIPQDDYHYLRHLFQFKVFIQDLNVAKDGISIYDLEGIHQVEYPLSDKFDVRSNR